MGKYHPHGDSASTTRSCAWRRTSRMRYPLVDGQGNFGSVDGDPPAAMRYTEIRMSPHRRGDARRHRQGDRRLHPELRRHDRRAAVLPARSRTCCQRLVGHRGRHGDQHPAAQPRRGRRRADRADRRTRAHARRADAASSRARISRPGLHPRQRADPRGLPRPAAASSQMRAQAEIETDERTRQRARSSSPRFRTR